VRFASVRTATSGVHYEGLWCSGRQPRFRSTTIASGAFPDAELLPSARTSPSVRLGHGLRPTTSCSGLLNQPDKHESLALIGSDLARHDSAFPYAYTFGPSHSRSRLATTHY